MPVYNPLHKYYWLGISLRDDCGRLASFVDKIARILRRLRDHWGATRMIGVRIKQVRDTCFASTRTESCLAKAPAGHTVSAWTIV